MSMARALICTALSIPFLTMAADRVLAPHRTNAQNYKDMALAACIETAYKGSPAGADAALTKSVFLEWTYYDISDGNRATDNLVGKYLRRDYSNPMEGYGGARFDLLKCVDMYHSQELSEQTRKYIPHPNWIGDQPPGKRK